MKRLLLALFALSLFYFGCSDLSTNTNPVKPQTSSKVAIKLPAKLSSSVEAVFSASNLIVGNKGGTVELHNSFASGMGLVTMDAELTVPVGAYNGAENITMQIGDDAGIDFSPSMIFNTPVILNLKFTGVDLSGVDPNAINFYYFAPDGSTQLVKSDSIYINVSTGTLQIFNAQLPHFSRYNWAK